MKDDYKCTKCGNKIDDVMFTVSLGVEKPTYGGVQTLLSNVYSQLCPKCAATYSLNHAYLAPKTKFEASGDEAKVILREIIDRIQFGFDNALPLNIFSIVEAIDRIIDEHYNLGVINFELNEIIERNGLNTMSEFQKNNG